MNCLIEFLTDGKQKSLINMVQNRDETFENELESYQRLFIVELKHCIGKARRNTLDVEISSAVPTVSSGKNYKNLHNRKAFCQDDNCYFAYACSNFHNILSQIKEEEIRHFFQGIKLCYTLWIDSQTTLALEALDRLLKEHELIHDVAYIEDENSDDELIIQNITEQVFFRGRLTDQFLSKLEMFHVPYNKRYNLHNERFSLTGQPLLYLGNSIADVMEELGVNWDDREAIHRLRVSSFEFTSTGKKRRIFDLRCNIWNDMKGIQQPTFSKKKFFRNILSIICSFQKRKELEGYAFKEEYVIPQMLAQVLKQNHYDGICYYSTKQFREYCSDMDSQKIIGSELSMFYRENIALFTHMNNAPENINVNIVESIYDEALRKDLEISMPVSIQNIKKSSISDLIAINQAIGDCYKDICISEANIGNTCTSKNCEMCQETCANKRIETARSCRQKSESIVDFYKAVFSKIKVKEKAYSETALGQIHLQLLIGILNRLLVEMESEVSDEKLRCEEPRCEEPRCEEPLPPFAADEVMQCCDVLGRETEQEPYREVHKNGKLHKGQIIFIFRREQADAEILVAMNKKPWDHLFYGHPHIQHSNHQDLNDLDKWLQRMGFSLDRNTEPIGSFLYRNTSILEFPAAAKDFSLKLDFEYVEILLSEENDADNANEELVWKSLSDLKDLVTKNFSILSGIHQQALPILIKYLEDKAGDI